MFNIKNLAYYKILLSTLSWLGTAVLDLINLPIFRTVLWFTARVPCPLVQYSRSFQMCLVFVLLVLWTLISSSTKLFNGAVHHFDRLTHSFSSHFPQLGYNSSDFMALCYWFEIPLKSHIYPLIPFCETLSLLFDLIEVYSLCPRVSRVLVPGLPAVDWCNGQEQHCPKNEDKRI